MVVAVVVVAVTAVAVATSFVELDVNIDDVVEVLDDEVASGASC